VALTMTYDHRTTMATIELLAETFPKAFSIWQRRRKPLKLGIHNDVLTALDGAITAKELSAAMRVYCGNWHYLKACKEGAPRIDLAGEPCGSVSAKEAADANQRLAAQRDRRKRQQEAKAQAKAKAEIKARNADRISLADLRRAAQERRAAAA
jgi:ProP effector